jgi:hypothetical protein
MVDHTITEIEPQVFVFWACTIDSKGEIVDKVALRVILS